MKKIKLMFVICLTLVMCISTCFTSYATVNQTITEKQLEIGKKHTYLFAYAAFDRFGTSMSNGYSWDYTGKASIVNSQKAGKLKLTIQGQATVKTSASVSVGAGDTINAGISSSWQAISESYSQTKSIKKQAKRQTTSDTSNLIVTPRKYYKTGTACIIVTAAVKFENSNKWHKIRATA